MGLLSFYEELEKRGYRRAGNWYYNDAVSVNLFTHEVKSVRQGVSFSYIFSKIDLIKIDDICKLITSL